MRFDVPVTIKQLAAHVDGELVEVNAKADLKICGLDSLEKAASDEISFLINPTYRKYLNTTRAAVVIVEAEHAEHAVTTHIITNNSRLALAKIMQQCLDNNSKHIGVSSAAIIGSGCQIDATANIAANCTIGNNCKIGENVLLEPGVVVGDNCTLADGVRLYPNVVLYPNVCIGSNTVIHGSTVIGSDGFGYAQDNGKWVKMPHVGGVRIDSNVEIGSCVSIDRGFISNTIIGEGCIIDNQVQIGHNVEIGAHTAIAGCVGIAGSTKIGASCLIGGGSSIAGHLTIADGVCITATSSVNRSLHKAGMYSSGMPVKENRIWRRNIARFGQLDELAKRVKSLEKNAADA